jgi:hypothetical protein
MTPDQEKQRVIERVRKLLNTAAADSGATPNEMATAARMAQALMKKFNLEQSDVIFKELKNAANLDMVWVRATTRKNAPRKNDDTPLWAQIMAGPCGDLFDCQVNLRFANIPQGRCSVVAFYGYKTDVVVCAWTYEYLLDCVRRLGRAYEEQAERLAAQGGSKSNREALDAFRYGCAAEIGRRLQQMVYDKKREEQQSSTSTALVVSKRNAIVDAFPDQSFGREECKPTKNAVALMAGRIAGSKVALTPNPLEDKSKQ